jgi:hypothetical protein
MIDPELTVLHMERRAHQLGWPRLIFMWLVNSFFVSVYNRSFTKSGRRFADLHRASRSAASCLEDRKSTRCFTLAVAMALLSGNFLQRSAAIPTPRAS